MMHYYGTISQYIEEDDYPAAVMMNIGTTEHGLAHFTDRDEINQFKKEYKYIRRYRRKLFIQYQVCSIDSRSYHAFLRTNWLDLTNHFSRKWGVERVPLMLRADIHQVREDLEMKVLKWTPISLINKSGKLVKPTNPDVLGGIVSVD